MLTYTLNLRIQTALLVILALMAALARAGDVNNKTHATVDSDYPGDIKWRVDGESSLKGRLTTPGTLTLWVNDKSHVVLSGSAGKVKVEASEGGSVLDLRNFVADEIVFENSITNNTVIYVHATSRLVFKETIDDRSTVYMKTDGHVEVQELKSNSTVYYSGTAPTFRKVDDNSKVAEKQW